MGLRSTNLILKAFRVTRTRPTRLLKTIRGYLLFHLSAILRKVLPFPGITLKDNVRLQKNSSLMAEAPDASIVVGKNSIVYENAFIASYGKGEVHIGDDSIIGDIKVASRYSITIGKRFLSSWNVFIQDYDPHPKNASERALQVEKMVDNFRPTFASEKSSRDSKDSWNFPGESIRIGDDVWMGANCTILKGARIGNGCIVASNSVVLNGVYPDNHVIAGNPAKIVKRIED